MISGRAVLAWGDLEARRRRRARRRPWALPPLGYAVLAGAAAAAAVAGRAATHPAAAERVWVAAAATGFAAVVLAAPFRLFWRRDAALLLRLPIPGRALLWAGLVRAVRAGARAAVMAAVAAIPLAVWGGGAVFLRHGVVAVCAGACAAALGTAAAVAAGGIVASDRARALIDSFTGEFRAPATSWLGLLPAMAAAATVLAVIVAGGWARTGAAGQGAVLLLSVVPAAAALALMWAWTRAAAIMPAAAREVSALDQERLAHVERHGPSILERGWARLSLRDAKARLLFSKDAALARRRYPLAYLVTPLGVAAVWIAVLADAANLATWTGAVIAGLAAYAVLFSQRLTEPPTEMPRLLAALPVRARSIAGAKRAPSVLRILVAVALCAGPALARAGNRAALAVAVLGIAALALVASRLAVGRRAGSP